MIRPKVLIACEESAVIREAMASVGCDATSCDLKPSRKEGQHIQGDVLKVLDSGWDMMIAHPPCTYLTVTGNKWMKEEFQGRWPNRLRDRVKAIEFFCELYLAPIPKIAIENPVGIMSSIVRQPDQIIQPYYFGDEARKSTCLWLKGLPLLIHASEDTLFESKTHVGQGEIIEYSSGRTMAAWYANAPRDERSTVRSVTFQGVARQMAEQWGKLLINELNEKNV